MGVFTTICAFIIVGSLVLKIYFKVTTGWCKSKTCLVGKTAIVTGANTGIGFETALDFAKRGARVILACRHEGRAEDARKKIVAFTGNENVVIKLVDMASFKSVRAFAKNINETEDSLDILVNNAGVMGLGAKTSIDGHLLGMQVNYYSVFLLTNLLIGLMKKSQSSRIVNVSSLVAAHSKLNLNKLDAYSSDGKIYADSKLCNILFTIELAKKLHDTNITTYSLHPGAVTTDILRYKRNLMGLIVWILVRLFCKNSEEGAQTTIHCSVAKGLEKYNGEHFADCQRVSPYKSAMAPGLATKLWEKTEEIVELKPEEIQI